MRSTITRKFFENYPCHALRTNLRLIHGQFTDIYVKTSPSMRIRENPRHPWSKKKTWRLPLCPPPSEGPLGGMDENSCRESQKGIAHRHGKQYLCSVKKGREQCTARSPGDESVFELLKQTREVAPPAYVSTAADGETKGVSSCADGVTGPSAVSGRGPRRVSSRSRRVPSTGQRSVRGSPP